MFTYVYFPVPMLVVGDQCFSSVEPSLIINLEAHHRSYYLSLFLRYFNETKYFTNKK